MIRAILLLLILIALSGACTRLDLINERLEKIQHSLEYQKR